MPVSHPSPSPLPSPSGRGGQHGILPDTRLRDLTLDSCVRRNDGVGPEEQTRSRARPMVGASVPGGLCGNGAMDD